MTAMPRSIANRSVFRLALPLTKNGIFLSSFSAPASQAETVMPSGARDSDGGSVEVDDFMLAVI
jgi:hypothetical protein